MKYLFDYWEKIEKEIADKYIYIFLEYDGTIVPFARRPDQAVIPDANKELLKRLSLNLQCEVAIISGRKLSDIKQMVGLRNIIYSGNHGLEVEGPNIKFKSFILFKYEKTLSEIKKQLQDELSVIPGAWVEDKGLSLSVHYRLVASQKIPQVKIVFQEATIIDRLKGLIKTKSGKMILEIQPPVVWDKGKIVLWLLARQTFLRDEQIILPIYVGNNLADEDAFRVLRNKGLTVCIGESKGSLAEYYLNNSREVAELLQRILRWLKIAQKQFDTI